MGLYLKEPAPHDISYLVWHSLAKSCDRRIEAPAIRPQNLLLSDLQDLIQRPPVESALFLCADAW